MSTSSVLNRVSGNDFFAILAPGLFNFIALYSIFIAITDSAVTTFWQIISTLSTLLVDSPVYILFIIFLAYLLGSIFRALPVRFAEKLIPPFSSKFPYPKILEGVIEKLQTYSDYKTLDKNFFPAIGKSYSKEVFNFWKSQLCIQSKDGFSFYQSFETRSRFFAGMLWSSILGIVSSVIIMFSTWSIHPIYSIAGPILFFSMILFFTFGFNLRRIRRQEVRALLFLHLSLKAKNTLENS